jgi:hypothetical protein
MLPTTLRKRVLGGLAVAGLAAILAGPAAAAQPMPISIDPPTLAKKPAVSSAKPVPVPPRMPPGYKGPPVRIPVPTATDKRPATKSTSPVAIPPLPVSSS